MKLIAKKTFVKVAFGTFVPVAVFFVGDTYAQTLFECRNASGQLQYSDRPCPDSVKAVPIPMPTESNLLARKAENDARVGRDKALANSMQGGRVAEEQAGFAVQNQQVEAARGITSKVVQERTSQNSGTTTIVPRDSGLSR